MKLFMRSDTKIGEQILKILVLKCFKNRLLINTKIESRNRKRVEKHYVFYPQQIRNIYKEKTPKRQEKTINGDLEGRT